MTERPSIIWHPVALSSRQIRTMDRVGGAELVLPWPEGLPAGAVLALDEERDAVAEEHAAAEAITGAACDAAGLVLVRTVVATLRRPPGLPRPHQIEQHLVPLIIGRRWVHATGLRGGPPPPICWHAAERIGRVAPEDMR